MISFILIIYLQRRGKSSRRRINAIISNRLRDAIFLLILYRGKDNWKGEKKGREGEREKKKKKIRKKKGEGNERKKEERKKRKKKKKKGERENIKEEEREKE